jgi:hypothetical protein
MLLSYFQLALLPIMYKTLILALALICTLPFFDHELYTPHFFAIKQTPKITQAIKILNLFYEDFETS